MRSETQVPCSRRPSAGATAVPVAETPIVETPIAEAPIMQAPAVEAPIAEAPVAEAAVMEEMPAEAPIALLSPPAPMETGGAGDGGSWAEQVEAGDEEPFQRSRLAKHPRSQSRRRELTSRLPFPSRTMRGDSPLLRCCMNMQLHNPPPHTMQQAGQSGTCTPICCHSRPQAWGTKWPA